MALVTCPDCGKKFSDKASNCPECSCPIEYAIKDVENSGSVIKSEIIGKYNILGREFLLNRSLLISLTLKVEIRNMEVSIENAATEFYSTFRSIDELIEKLPEFISSEIEKILESTIKRLIIFKIYDLDKEAFFKKYYFDNFNAEPIMSEIVEKYLNILKYESELSQYREYIKQIHRNRWSGGGFGITGAVKGSIKAQLLNIGTGFLYSLPEHAQRVNDEYEINRRKRELFEDPNTLKSVSKAIKITGTGIISSFIMELESKGVMEKYNYQPETANSILNNYIRNNMSLTEDVKSKMLQDAFFADPSSYKVYLNILLAEVDDKGDVRKLAKILGYINEIEKDIEKYKYLKVEKLKEAYEDELEWIYEKSCEGIKDNQILFEILDKCLEISREINHLLYDEIMFAVKSRVKYGINISDAQDLKKYINTVPSLLSEEIYGTELIKLVDDAEKLRDREIVWDEIKKNVDIYNKVCRFSLVYLLETYHKAIRGDIAAQDIVFMYLFGDKCEKWSQKDVDKYSEGLKGIYVSYDNVHINFDEYNETKTDVQRSSFYKLLYSIYSIFSGKTDEGIKVLNEIKDDCPLAYYCFAIVNKDKRLQYLELAARGGSCLALKHFAKIIDKEYPMEKEQMLLSVGTKNTDSLWLSWLGTAIYGLGEGDFKNRSYESYFEVIDYVYDIHGVECEKYIEIIDGYFKNRYTFYSELLKNSSIRYLMNDDLNNEYAYPKRAYYLTFFQPLDGSILSSYTLWEVCDEKNNVYLWFFDKGLTYRDGKNNIYISYKDYQVGSIQWDVLLDSFSKKYGIRDIILNEFLEELIAMFKYYYIIERKWVNWDEYLNPYDGTIRRGAIANDVDSIPFDKEIEEIIILMKDNKFLEASRLAYSLSGGNISTVAYAFYAAILKVARNRICENWFEQYIELLKIRYSNITRSDIALENGRIRSLLEAKKMLRYGGYFPANYFGYVVAAAAGRREAIEVIAKLCENKVVCSHKEWGNVWRERIIDSPINRFNIFDMVEQEWIKAGNERPVSLHKVIAIAKGEKPLYPYYGYEDVNKSHHWYILLQFSKIFDYYDNNIMSGIYKGTGVGKGNKELENNIRQYYGIPQNEIIYIMQDATILNKKFYKGVIFTDRALYARNSSLIKIEWGEFTEADFSFGILNYTIRGQKFEMPNPEGKIKWLLDYLSKNADKNVIDRCDFLKICEKLDLDKCYEDSFFSAPQ